MRRHFFSVTAVVLALLLFAVLPLSAESEVKSEERHKTEDAGLETSDMGRETGDMRQGGLESQVSSLRSGVSSLFADRRAANVGDIVTVIIAESSSASKSASTQTSKTSNKEGEITDLIGISRLGGVGKFFPLKGAMNSDSGYTGSGSTTRSGSLTTKISARVTSKFANGNLFIEGKRHIVLNNEKESITISGIIRPEDISAGNIILSTKLADVQISYEGEGIITKQQRPGILSRILSWLWIF